MLGKGAIKMALNIIHVDMDAFYASVEKRDNPELEGKPVIVGGDPEGRGVVAAACYEVREYGVHSAMSAAEAKRRCPHAIFLPVRMDRYQEVSAQIFEILGNYTPVIEKISVDEAFLDIKGTERLFGSPREVGRKIQKEIMEKTGLQASVGIAPNKFLAKLASDMDKPAGFTVIEEDKIQEILDPLPIENIWGVGEKTEEKLHKINIKTIRELKKISEEDLVSIFGNFGQKLYNLARGIDDREVEKTSVTKSISHEQTFSENMEEEDYLLSVLMEFSGKVARRLRKKNLKAETVFVKVSYDIFKSSSRQITYQRAFHDTETIYFAGKKLLQENNLFRRPIRLLGIGVSNLIPADQEQMSLFGGEDEDDNMVEAIDRLKDKFGESSVLRAREIIHKDKEDLEDNGE